jgi:excisionase family DNA binding protein
MAYGGALADYEGDKSGNWSGVGRLDRKQNSRELLLTPREVASMFRVDPKTVTRWAKAGKLSAIRTLGGHRRYREAEVREYLSEVRVTATG